MPDSRHYYIASTPTLKDSLAHSGGRMTFLGCIGAVLEVGRRRSLRIGDGQDSARSGIATGEMECLRSWRCAALA